MDRTKWNPRVLLWARVRGIEEELIKHGTGGDPYRVDGLPWTVVYSQWVRDMWKDFHCLCHGTPERGECCAGDADTHRRFDEWLSAQCQGES
jgi:hypothetical protein